MSIPPGKYTVPPPNLNVPPPRIPPVVPKEIPPPTLYRVPPPFLVPAVPPPDKTSQFLPVNTLPPLHLPPPRFPPPIKTFSVPPPFPPPPPPSHIPPPPKDVAKHPPWINQKSPVPKFDSSASDRTRYEDTQFPSTSTHVSRHKESSHHRYSPERSHSLHEREKHHIISPGKFPRSLSSPGRDRQLERGHRESLERGPHYRKSSEGGSHYRESVERGSHYRDSLERALHHRESSERGSHYRGSPERGSHCRELLERRSHHRGPSPGRESFHRYSPGRSHRESSEHRRIHELERRERYLRESRHRSRSRSPSYHSHRSQSPSAHSHHHRSKSPSHHHREIDRQRERERYYREKHLRDKYADRDRLEYERRKAEARGHSPHRDHRSHSRFDPRDERRSHHHSPSHRRHTPLRESHCRSRARELSPRRRDPGKPLTDREKILEEFRKNYCKTGEDFIEKLEKWSRDHHDDDEGSKMWYRSSPAELYYKPNETGTGVQQTARLRKLCEAFVKQLIERGRKARPEVDELPPLKPAKAKMCKHHLEDNSSSSSSSDESLDEDGLQGYTDRIMMELQRKQSHPRRLHPEMWFNNTGEMNAGPLCRCSARARRHGMRHGVYAGETTFPKCIPDQNNVDRLYHYRITVSPPTNFLIKSPTIIGHDEHEFLFSGFSMFTHYKLAKLPTCKVIRFNIEYTILYVEEPMPTNFTIQELDLFEEYLFYELLELIDLDLGKATDTTCSQFHFMPRFVRFLPEGGCEILSMCEILKYLLQYSGPLIARETLSEVHDMDHYSWQKFVDTIKGMIVTYPGKKPCSVRVDQLDRSPPNTEEGKAAKEQKTYYPEIVHFGIRPPQLSYAGNPEYQKAWRYYVKYRHLIANMAKPSFKDRQKLAAKEAKLQEMRTQTKMKRDVTVAISSEGFHTTGLMCDVVQHAMLIPVLVRHLRFHKSLEKLEEKIGYTFEQRLLLQTSLTHPSYRENFGTNPDHARNSLTNCGIRQPEYGDRRIHYTRKKGIVTLINIMSRFGKHSETESEIKHNERLEFLGDAVVEFLSSIHLFKMFPGLAEGGLATYRASIVQNQHLAQLAKNIDLEQYMLYAHGSDLCREVVMRHAMANCFEALMGALFLDAGIEIADRVFSLALWYKEPELLETWNKERWHPLQEQEPLGDRKYIKDFDFLKKLIEFEESIGVQFKHIRLLARAFTDRSVGFTHLTLGSNQRLEFLGDTVLQLVVSDRLYRHFPDHHEGHLSLLRSSLVNNRTQSMVCDDLNMSTYAIYNNPKAKPTTKKHKADLLEAFLGALFIDKSLEYCQAFCNACLFPRLQEFIMNQDWNDPKSKLQQCCLTLRSMEGGEPDIPLYKVIECLGPTNTRIYTVGVYFRGTRLAAARGHSIQEAEMNAAEQALSSAHELFPQLDHQKRVIAKTMKKKRTRDGQDKSAHEKARHRIDDRVPKAYRLERDDKLSDSSDDSDSEIKRVSDEEVLSPKSDNSDSGLDSDDVTNVPDEKLEKVEVSSLLMDMERLKEDLIRRNEYEKLKEKCKQVEDSDDD